MDQATRDLVAAFGMGTIGAPPVGEGEDATAAGSDGLGMMESVARYDRAVRALVEIDAAHPELGIREELGRVLSEIRAGKDVAAALSRVDALLEAHKDLLSA